MNFDCFTPISIEIFYKDIKLDPNLSELNLMRFKHNECKHESRNEKEKKLKKKSSTDTQSV